MVSLSVLAKGDEADELDELDDEQDPTMGLPKELVDAVLALQPMQRASLSALIAGSLANELLETRAAAGSLLESLKKNPKLAKHGRKRARS
jgi:hypothetical protein